MRIGIPVWGSRVSPVLDAAQSLLVVEVEDGKEVSRAVASIAQGQAPSRAGRICALGVNVVLCGAISRPLAGLLASYAVTVIPWITGDVETVLAAYFDGSLSAESLQMPGCRRGRQGGGRRRRERRWQPPFGGGGSC